MKTLEYYTGYTSEDLEALSQFHCSVCNKVLEYPCDHVEIDGADICHDCIT